MRADTLYKPSSGVGSTESVLSWTFIPFQALKAVRIPTLMHVVRSRD